MPWCLPKCVELIHLHEKKCTRMFVAALFVIAKMWKQLRCPSGSEQINKL